MNQVLFGKIAAALVRFALTGVFGYLTMKGVFTQELSDEALAGIVAGIVALVWSLYEKIDTHTIVNLALDSPAGTKLSAILKK